MTETKENIPQDSDEKKISESTENTPQYSEEKNTTEPTENTPQDTEEKRMLKFINSIVEKGYSPETAETLWENRCQREAILNDPNLSDEEKRKAIRETRQNDLEVMLEDQKEGQKIKYAFRLYNKTQKMVEAIQNAKTKEEKQQKTEEYDKFVEENKEWAKDNKEIMRIVREDIRNKKTPPGDNSHNIKKDNTKDDKKFSMPDQTQTKTIELSKDTTRKKIEANKEKTISSKRKKKTVKLTPTHNNIDENKTPIISLYNIKNKKLRA